MYLRGDTLGVFPDKRYWNDTYPFPQILEIFPVFFILKPILKLYLHVYYLLVKLRASHDLFGQEILL